MAKCADTDHDYRKFDDASVVCRKCADQRVVDLAALVARFPQPIYLPCPYPHFHQPNPYIWGPTWITSGGTTTQPVIDSVTYDTATGRP